MKKIDRKKQEMAPTSPDEGILFENVASRLSEEPVLRNLDSREMRLKNIMGGHGNNGMNAVNEC